MGRGGIRLWTILAPCKISGLIIKVQYIKKVEFSQLVKSILWAEKHSF